jgi:hypothetical protein
MEQGHEQKGGSRYSETEIRDILAQGGTIKIHRKDGSKYTIPLHLHTIKVKDGVVSGFWTEQPDSPQGKFDIPLEDIENIEQE